MTQREGVREESVYGGPQNIGYTVELDARLQHITIVYAPGKVHHPPPPPPHYKKKE